MSANDSRPPSGPTLQPVRPSEHHRREDPEDTPVPLRRESKWTPEGISGVVLALLALVGVFWSGGGADQRLKQLESWQTSHVIESKELRAARDTRDKAIESDVSALREAHGTRLTQLEDSWKEIRGLLGDIKKQLDEQAAHRNR